MGCLLRPTRYFSRVESGSEVLGCCGRKKSPLLAEAARSGAPKKLRSGKYYSPALNEASTVLLSFGASVTFMSWGGPSFSWTNSSV